MGTASLEPVVRRSVGGSGTPGQSPVCSFNDGHGQRHRYSRTGSDPAPTLVPAYAWGAGQGSPGGSASSKVDGSC